MADLPIKVRRFRPSDVNLSQIYHHRPFFISHGRTVLDPRATWLASLVNFPKPIFVLPLGEQSRTCNQEELRIQEELKRAYNPSTWGHLLGSECTVISLDLKDSQLLNSRFLKGGKYRTLTVSRKLFGELEEGIRKANGQVCIEEGSFETCRTPHEILAALTPEKIFSDSCFLLRPPIPGEPRRKYRVFYINNMVKSISQLSCFHPYYRKGFVFPMEEYIQLDGRMILTWFKMNKSPYETATVDMYCDTGVAHLISFLPPSDWGPTESALFNPITDTPLLGAIEMRVW